MMSSDRAEPSVFTPTASASHHGKRAWVEDDNPEPREPDIDLDPHALSRRHRLLFNSLQDAVIKSHYIPSQPLFSLSLVCKEASKVVRQNVRAIGGDDAKILLALPRFPAVCHLKVIIKQYHETVIKGGMANREVIALLAAAGNLGPGRFGVPSSISQGEGVDLSRLRSLVIGIDSRLNTKDAPPRDRRRQRAPSSSSSPSADDPGVSIVDDPVASVIVPALRRAHLTDLSFHITGTGDPPLPGFTLLLDSPCLSHLVSLTVTSSHNTGNELAGLVLEGGGAFPHLISLVIRGPDHIIAGAKGWRGMNVASLLRGVASRHSLPSLQHLTLEGYLGAQQIMGRTSISCILENKLDLSRLTSFHITDESALKEIPGLLDDDDASWALRSLGFTIICSGIAGDGSFDPALFVVLRDCAEGLLDQLVYEAPRPEIAMAALKALLAGRTALNCEGAQTEIYWGGQAPTPATQIAQAKSLTAVIAQFLLIHSSDDPALVQFLIRWFASNRATRTSGPALDDLLLSGQPDYSGACQAILNAAFSTITRRAVSQQETMARESAIVFIIRCLMLLDPAPPAANQPPRIWPANTRAQATLDHLLLSSVCNMTISHLVTYLVRQHTTMTSRACKLLASMLKPLSRSTVWSSCLQMMTEISKTEVALLIMNHKPSAMQNLHLAAPPADQVAKELGRHPKRYDLTPLAVLNACHMIGGYHSVIGLVYRAGRWEGFWQAVVASVVKGGRLPAGQAQLLLELLDEARERHMGKPPSHFLLPPELKPLVEQQLDVLSMFYAGKRSLTLYLLDVFWSGPLPYIQSIVDACKATSTTSLATPPKNAGGIRSSSNTTTLTAPILLPSRAVLAVTGAWALLESSKGRPPALSNEVADLLLSHTNFLSSLTRVIAEEHRQNGSIWRALAFLVKSSGRFHEAIYQTQGTRGSLLSCLVKAFQSFHFDKTQFFITLARKGVRHLVLTLVEEAVAATQPEAFITKVASVLGSLHTKEILCAEHVGPVLTLWIVGPGQASVESVSNEYKDTIKYLAHRLMQYGNPLGQEVAEAYPDAKKLSDEYAQKMADRKRARGEERSKKRARREAGVVAPGVRFSRRNKGGTRGKWMWTMKGGGGNCGK